jgi:hypothetical protein
LILLADIGGIAVCCALYIRFAEAADVLGVTEAFSASRNSL